jgi:hypothetical protein
MNNKDKVKKRSLDIIDLFLNKIFNLIYNMRIEDKKPLFGIINEDVILNYLF